MVSQLSKLVEQDPKTKEYYHLDELLKDESLYNNLRKIQETISKLEPNIEEMTPLAGTMSKQSKKAFQKMIAQYIEAVYVLNISQELKKIFEKFEPKAKEAREQEEKAAKRAELEAKRKLTPGAPIVAGSSEEAQYSPISRPYYDEPSGARFAEPTYIPDQAPRKPFGKSLSRKQPKSMPGKPGISKGLTPKEKKDKKTEADKKDDKIKKEKPEESRLEALKKRAEEMEKAAEKEGAKLFEKIESNVEDAAKIIKDSKTLEKLEQHLTGESPVDMELATEIVLT